MLLWRNSIKMDVSRLCRACMKDGASWERENFNSRAVEMFCFCTNIRITDEDKLPQQFCHDCIIKIESSYTFITEAQKVHVTLKNIISRTDTSIIIEPEGKPNPEIKLTLPDYKICSVIEETRYYEAVQKCIETPLVHENENESFGENNKPVNVEVSLEPAKEAEVTKDNVCTDCGKSFTSKTWFTKHVKKEHARKYTCAQCSKNFSRASLLSSHLVSHSEERNFACSVCGKRFKRRKQLSVHLQAHNDTRPYACDQCPARFKTKGTLKTHLLVHVGDKVFLCYFCGWSFAQAGNLKVHMRMHTGEKPYACARCPFRAAVASNLRRHERTHGAAKHYACHHCARGFQDASNLRRHIRTHTGALPYKCPACPSAFSDSWKRKAHLMRTHKIPLQDIPRMRTDGRVIQ